MRRHIERVAAQRRALPPGGPVTGDYRFQGEDGPTDFAGLFGGKQTLVVYSYMFGPQRERPCPMCTNLLGRVGGQCRRHRAKSLARRRRALADRAPDRLEEGARLAQSSALQRPRRRLFARLFRAIAADGSDEPALNVFTRRDGTIRHFWSGEMSDGPPTPARTRAARPTPRRYGWCWTRRRKGGAWTGIRSSRT